jgi:hypothetical protein
LLGNARERHVAVAPVMGRQLQPPARQVTHRWLANQPREAIGKRGARKADIAPEVVDGPLLGYASVQQRRSTRDERIFEACQPSGLFVRESGAAFSAFCSCRARPAFSPGMTIVQTVARLAGRAPSLPRRRTICI